jgi:hypothetical protein
MATRYETYADKKPRATLGRSAATGRFVLAPVKKPGTTITLEEVRSAIHAVRAEGKKS